MTATVWYNNTKGYNNRIKRKFVSKFAISLETGNQCWQHSCTCCSTKGYCWLYDMSRVEKVMMILVQTTVLCSTKSKLCSNFLSGRAKCSNSRPTCRPAKYLGRTLGITLEIQEFTGTSHVFLLVQKPWRIIGMLFSTNDSLVLCSDIFGLITELGVTMQPIGKFSSMLPSEA